MSFLKCTMRLAKNIWLKASNDRGHKKTVSCRKETAFLSKGKIHYCFKNNALAS